MTDRNNIRPCGECKWFKSFQWDNGEGKCTKPFGGYNWVNEDEIKVNADCFEEIDNDRQN